MIPAEFTYRRATSVADALALLAEHGDEAKLLAGGHSLLPMMKMRLATPTVLVDVARIDALHGVRVQDGALVIGAATTHAEVATSAEVREHSPLLAHAAGLVGDPQVRNRGTIGGSLAHADPAADVPLACLTVDATAVIEGHDGPREVGLGEFFTGYFSTVLGEDEILTAIRVPSAAGVGWGYEKFTRRANDWAVVGVATVAGRVGLANMAPSVMRAGATEAALADGASVEEAAALAADGTDPVTDLAADVEYRRHLARVLTGRALTTAAGG